MAENNLQNSEMFDKNSIKIIIDINNRINTQIIEAKKKLNLNKANSMKELGKQILSINTIISKQIHPFQIFFLENYKKFIKNNIQSLIFSNKIQNIGLYYLNKKEIEKVVQTDSIVKAIPQRYWNKLTTTILKTEKYSETISGIKKFYYTYLDGLITKEIKKVPIKIDDLVLKNYKKEFYKNRLSFEEYISYTESNNIGQSPTSKGINQSEQLRKQFEDALEKKKNEEQKNHQEKSFDNYKEYFDMSERELERARRKSSLKRKPAKKTRRRKYQ